MKYFYNLLCSIRYFLIIALGCFPYLAYSIDLSTGDFQTIVNAHSKTLTVWALPDNKSIYVFDFPGLNVQGRTFNRVTQLTEQIQANTGYPRVMTSDEFNQYIKSLRRTQADFAYGHDLLVSELVRFFNLVERDKIPLFPEEIVLREFLVERGLIKLWRGFYQSLQPGTVILSIPQSQSKKDDEPPVTEFARLTIFMHEISHAEYYTNQYYANYCRTYWNQSLNDAQRQAFITLFKKYNYDVTSSELVVNEMQAYLMFTPDLGSFSAKKLGISDDELVHLRVLFRDGQPPITIQLP